MPATEELTIVKQGDWNGKPIYSVYDNLLENGATRSRQQPSMPGAHCWRRPLLWWSFRLRAPYAAAQQK